MITIQNEDFDIALETRQLRGDQAETGAIVTFTGLVRDLVDNPLEEMFLEHYPGMTEKCLERIVAQAEQRWTLQRVRVIHRVGPLKCGDQIVFVGVASAHRGDAFEACQYIMDYLKRDAPFWKKEVTAARASWVEQKASDLDSADRWDR